MENSETLDSLCGGMLFKYSDYIFAWLDLGVFQFCR